MDANLRSCSEEKSQPPSCRNIERLIEYTYPPDLLLPPRPGMAPPILTWLAPTAPCIATVPGNSLPISVTDTTAYSVDGLK